MDLERVGRRRKESAGRNISPSLIEKSIGFALEIEDVFERIPASLTKHLETS
jgi:hypothetical protein